jgi:hypothetical protein
VFGLSALAVVAAVWAWGRNDRDRKLSWRTGARVLRTTVSVASDLIQESKEGESSHDQKHPSD